ncbi:dTDP-4-dehydrorhamnose 3,5-epimerase family protein [Rickettsiella endosymbiont of Dermanyssus gallinae]|uniref:dTDP-4-dehydrorhamnose 3,5-epimerase family protein n=1 Tax=Rickettsiella endosymbiont of Dermanyssus gallinae TaxID=2856608 RepID=UPI001C52DF38|nr:dTDP-4-dehydrorhamnose 3,5-epimerase family protein [Rickettsiella endosymbiont of Dermanyssus gallinae]
MGAYLIEMEPHQDERGYFSRFFCSREFKKHGLVTNFVQMSTSFNKKKGQIRGMHYQQEPYAETKLVRCTQGAIYDVIIDIRLESPTYYQYYGTELTAENKKMFYIPKGFAHGYKTLEDKSEVLYMMDTFYEHKSASVLSIKDINVYFTLC